MRLVGTLLIRLFSLTLRRYQRFPQARNSHVHIGHRSRDIENEAEVAFSKRNVDARYPDRIAKRSVLVWTGRKARTYCSFAKPRPFHKTGVSSETNS